MTIQEQYIFAAGVGGFLNLRKQGKHLVLLRGHGDDGPRAAPRLPAGRLTLQTVTPADLEADDARWRCERTLPASMRAGTAAAASAADAAAVGGATARPLTR